MLWCKPVALLEWLLVLILLVGGIACDSRDRAVAEDVAAVSPEVEVALARLSIVPGMSPEELEASVRDAWASFGRKKTSELLDIAFGSSPMNCRAAAMLGICSGAESAEAAFGRLSRGDGGAKFVPSVVGWLIFSGSDSISIAVGRGRTLVASDDDAVALVGHTLLSFALFQTTSPHPQTIVDRKSLAVDRSFWRKVLDRRPESWAAEDVLVEAWKSRIASRAANGDAVSRDAGGMMQGSLFSFMFRHGHPDHLSVWKAKTTDDVREYVRRMEPVSFQDFKSAFNILQLVD